MKTVSKHMHQMSPLLNIKIINVSVRLKPQIINIIEKLFI